MDGQYLRMKFLIPKPYQNQHGKLLRLLTPVTHAQALSERLLIFVLNFFKKLVYSFVMVTDLLDINLKLLVLQHGRPRVLQSLAHISEVSEENIKNQLASIAKAKAAKSAKTRPTSDELLARMDLPTAKRELLFSLMREFENKRFLGEMRLVGKFLREHQVGTVPKTRLLALPKVLQILADMPESELENLLSDSANQNGGSGFSNLAGAIMGR